MLKIRRNATYSRNDRRGHQPPCVICGKPIIRRPRYLVHLFSGDFVVTEAEADKLGPGGDLGLYPVGTDCLRRHPDLRDYVYVVSW